MRSHVARLLYVVTAICCVGAGGLLSTYTRGSPGSGAFTVDESFLSGRLRTFAEPGDFGLKSERVTAIVRRRDGVLVDFWPNAPARPTAPQLGSLRAIDGLWRFEPWLVWANRAYEVETESTSSSASSVVVTQRASLGPSEVRMQTTYRLDERRAAIVIETRISHERGSFPLVVSVADGVKWGNVDYFAEGHDGPLPMKFNERARWVGRRGASGDLVLRSREPFVIELEGRHPGFRPQIFARHRQLELEPGDSALVVRALEYRSIQVPLRAEGTARIRARITDEQHRPLPSKMGFRGVGKTKDPDFGSTGDETGCNRFVWSGDGLFDRSLAPGTYEVTVTAGIERSAKTWTVELAEGESRSLEATLQRVIETPGWVAADLHLHQAPSVDADIGLPARILSIAAEGVELAVATDHYAVTDYAPTVRALRRSRRLAAPLLTVIGSEVSTTGERFGHFNLFPMKLGDRIRYHDTTPPELFSDMRDVAPDALIQINHPRWGGLGYFDYVDLDRETARPRRPEMWVGDFDAIEVYNGLDIENWAAVKRPFLDWLHLLGRGHRYTATGNSDSHNLAFLDPGIVRTLVHYGDAQNDDDDRAADVGAVIEAVRAGRAVVTSGPVLEASIDGAGPGETVAVSAGRATLSVRIRAAPRIDVRRLEVYVGPGENPVLQRLIPATDKVLRFREQLAVPVDPPSFVVVLIRGERPLSNVFSEAAKPLAFSNPIWLERKSNER